MIGLALMRLVPYGIGIDNGSMWLRHGVSMRFGPGSRTLRVLVGWLSITDTTDSPRFC
ncbi:MAG: hypothetical protein NZ572_07475 [Thermoflexus sp.]|nr:hypothetical protein [Thermoflexus sp.]